MAGHRLRIHPTTGGFFAGLATKVDPVSGRRPVVLPDDKERWHFGIFPKEPLSWSGATNQRMRPNLPAIHYFSNDRPGWVAAVPAPTSLSGPVAGRADRKYESGEIVLDAGQQFAALSTVADPTIALADPAFWLPVTDRAEATEVDRCLLPLKFTYTITPNTGEEPSSLTINLKDISGTDALPPIVRPISSGQTGTPLDFSELKTGWYDLSVVGDTLYETTHRIYLDDSIYDQGAWGVIGIGRSAVDPTLRILEADGRLRQDGGGVAEPPVFEIRIRNRSSYRRYVAHPTQRLPASAGFVLDGDNRLVTADPFPLTRFGAPLVLNGGNGPVDLPNPLPENLRPEFDGRIYSDQYLGVLDL